MNTSDSAPPPSGSADAGCSSSEKNASSSASYRIVIVGGGEAGLALLDSLAETDLLPDVALIEPSTSHYDQPAWMRVGTEGMPKEQTRSDVGRRIPSQATWIRDRVTGLVPTTQTITTDSGTEIRYDYLVVALGTEVLWDRIRGLKPNLGARGICSVYGYDQAERTWEMIRAFEGGRALFTAPSSPYKGGTAPMTVLRRAESLWRDLGVRDRTEIFYTTASSAEESEGRLDRDAEEDLHVYAGYELLEVRPEAGEAVYSVTKGQSQSRDVLRYDLIHVVPPMRPPALVEESGLAYRDGPLKGYMEVDPESLRHRQFSNVFGLGDAIGIEGAKTGERAREQAAAVARTLQRIAEEE